MTSSAAHNQAAKAAGSSELGCAASAERISILEIPQDRRQGLLATGAPVYVSINPIEYHGPHLSLQNDLLVSRGLIGDVHARLRLQRPDWPLLIGPEICAGVGPVEGLGTVDTAFESLRQQVMGVAKGLAEIGAERVVFMTFHGDPRHSHAIFEGVRELGRRKIPAFAPMNVLLGCLLEGDAQGYEEALAPIESAEQRAVLRAAMRTDTHAGFFETSVALHYAPEAVSPGYQSLPPCPPVAPQPILATWARLARAAGRATLAAELELMAFSLGWHALKPFPGYTGNPAAANPASGAIFARLMVERFAQAAELALLGQGATPEPVMRWLSSFRLPTNWADVGKLPF